MTCEPLFCWVCFKAALGKAFRMEIEFLIYASVLPARLAFVLYII